jgi:hypothetical protein
MCGFKGTVSRDFLFQIFSMNHLAPSAAPENNTGVISIFFRKFAEIFTGQGAPQVSMLSAANLPPVLTTRATNMPPVSTTPVANFATSSAGVVDTGGKVATGANDTGGKFATGVNDAGWKLFQIFSMNHLPATPENNTRVISNFFPKICRDIPKSRCTTCISDTGGKFATVINDTGGKFATGINDTGGKFCQRCQRHGKQWEQYHTADNLM